MYETEILKKGISASPTKSISQHIELGESRLGLGIIMTMAALIGAWGVTCLVSGLGHAASIHELGSTLFIALTGI